MNIHIDNRTPYERDLMSATVNAEYERAVFMARPSVMLGLVPGLDGNQWCALYGPNLQEGMAGFGDSPDAAMEAFDKAWREKLPIPEAPRE